MNVEKGQFLLAVFFCFFAEKGCAKVLEVNRLLLHSQNLSSISSQECLAFRVCLTLYRSVLHVAGYLIFLVPPIKCYLSPQIIVTANKCTCIFLNATYIANTTSGWEPLSLWKIFLILTYIISYSVLFLCIFTAMLLMFLFLAPFYLYWTKKILGTKEWLFPLSVLEECSMRSWRKLFSLEVIWDKWISPTFQASENITWNSPYSQSKWV